MEYKLLRDEDFEKDLLKYFVRFQETKEVYYVKGDQTLGIKSDSFIDDWQAEDKIRVMGHLQSFLHDGGFVLGLYFEGNLIGFSGVSGKAYGANKNLFNLSYVHISRPYRGKGYGRDLFEITQQEARKRAFPYLYIGAHPGIKTIDFYFKMGCRLAEEIVMEVYHQEPRDLQLLIAL